MKSKIIKRIYQLLPQLGGVKPVDKTSQMTENIGVDSQGRLYRTKDITEEERTKWNRNGDYNNLDNKPTIPKEIIVDAELNETSTNAIQNQAVAKGLNKKANLTDLGINKYQKSETDATVVLENGSWTVFPTMTSLNVYMGDVDENKAFICGFQFTSGDTVTSLTLNNCTLTSNSDSVETNKTYEVNILDGSAIVREI